MSRTTNDPRQGDIFALLDQPPAAAPAKQSDGDSEDGPDDEALQCVDCGELGAIGEFIHHDEAGGALCPPCDEKREPNCSECGKAFRDERGIINVARFSLPTGKFLCYFCCEKFRERKPQRDLSRDEAEPEAIALLATLGWHDEGHRNRLLFHLRGGMRPERPTDAKGKPVKISAARVERIHRQTRGRTVHEIAEEYWPLIDAYDRALCEGIELEPGKVHTWHSHLREQMDDLEVEANQRRKAIHGGRRDYPGPYRLRALIKWRARREGRLPMYGINQRFRFETRGMHVVASTDYGLSFSIDQDKHKPGDPFISNTGYRSFCGNEGPPVGKGESLLDWARGVFEAYIDQPKGKDGAGGLGGKLERWIPWDAERWIDAVRRIKQGEKDRAAGLDTYDARRIEEHHEQKAKALAWMQERGIDPYELFPDAPRQEALL